MAKDSEIVEEAIEKKHSEDEIIALRYFTNLEKDGCLSKWNHVSDAEFDNMLQKQLAKHGLLTNGRACKKLGIEPEDVAVYEPIVMKDYISFMPTAANYARKGDDGKIRTSNYQVTWILCNRDQVFVFQCTFSLVEDDKVDHTEEYFFKDVTNFTTTEVSDEITLTEMEDGGCGKSAKEVTTKVKIEKTKFRISVPGEKFECALDLTPEMQEKIRALKVLLREKKA